MTEMSEQQRAAAQREQTHLREGGLMLLGGITLFWLVGAAVAVILVLPHMAALEATVCR